MNPGDLKVRINVDDGTHVAIAVEQYGRDHTWPDGISYAEALGIARRSAAVLGRLVAALSADLEEESLDHDCRRFVTWPNGSRFTDGCHVAAWSVADPNDFGEELSPNLEFNVPSQRRKAWIKRIRSTLAEILESDEFVPSDADEAEWRRGFETLPSTNGHGRLVHEEPPPEPEDEYDPDDPSEPPTWTAPKLRTEEIL